MGICGPKAMGKGATAICQEAADLIWVRPGRNAGRECPCQGLSNCESCLDANRNRCSWCDEGGGAGRCLPASTPVHEGSFSQGRDELREFVPPCGSRSAFAELAAANEGADEATILRNALYARAWAGVAQQDEEVAVHVQDFFTRTPENEARFANGDVNNFGELPAGAQGLVNGREDQCRAIASGDFDGFYRGAAAEGSSESEAAAGLSSDAVAIIAVLGVLLALTCCGLVIVGAMLFMSARRGSSGTSRSGFSDRRHESRRAGNGSSNRYRGARTSQGVSRQQSRLFNPIH